MDKLHIKYNNLKEYLKELRSIAIAFSGGVDSTFLLKTAHDVLGNKAVAITASACSFPKRELKESIDFCKKENIQQFIFEFEALKIEGFSANPKNRCYLCKKELLKKISCIAESNEILYIAEGSNIDDLDDYRPGMKAIKETDIKSPLRYAGLCKNEIRLLSKELGLPIWEKQSFACLASRFAYGEEITKEKLDMIDKAEQFLFDLNCSQVRVRIHGIENYIARIEVKAEEFNIIIENREKIYSYLKKIGFSYITLDIKGYRTGSMNEIIQK